MRGRKRGQEWAGQEVLSEREGGGEKRRRQGPPESKPRAKGQVEGQTKSSEGSAAVCMHVPAPPVHFPGDGDILPVPWNTWTPIVFVALDGHSEAWEPAKSIVLSARLTLEQTNSLFSH